MEKVLIGDKSAFAISYRFFEKARETELEMYVDGENILAFSRNGKRMTTRWNLDEIAEWMRSFLKGLKQDPYPVEASGQFAAEKDIQAREYDTDDMTAFDAYYDALDAWNVRHRWHTASAGAILADVYFQLVSDAVEISWNNQDADDGVEFQEQLGGAKVPKAVFVRVVDDFLKAYAAQWF